MTENLVRPASSNISVVTLTWNKDPQRLRDLLWTLVNQTRIPNEIVVVDGNDNATQQQETIDTCIPFTRMPISINIILAHLDSFNMSKGFNIGIKQTSEEVDYVMVAGVDMLFGPAYIETVLGKMSGDVYCVSQCGFLIEDTYIPEKVYSHWNYMCDHQIKPNPPVKISTGAQMTVARDWWFEYRGYDEVNYPFALADSDVTHRMKTSGKRPARIMWEEAQILHVWHEPSPLVAELGGGDKWPNEDTLLYSNSDEWGEYD